ncbi:hypothetical protein [Evansella cellulosilytica]|uniref:Uncharacterized protein n=1 Tax=Evansella cellulosilytica (strain ATCC 21833 / DSM 2522 / FERM P-1141 / JCM 9156 / N-4) TaxID=649639 RepID=E6TYF1_EVAC2|nr:hypothetical protein [Evansella cellulosilytica]ADU28889.1 hypothetical protein Bcell_0607 [Evansella cellulosilytica DSM 2522]
MDKKQMISFGMIIVFIAVVIIFFRDSETDITMEVDIDDERIDYIDVINLREENEQLKKEIENLDEEYESSYFDLMRIIVDSDLVYELFPGQEATTIIYREVSEDQYTLFYKDKHGYTLNVNTRNAEPQVYFHFIEQAEYNEMSWSGVASGDSYTIGGFITDERISKVQLLQNNNFTRESTVVELDYHFDVWYIVNDGEVPTEDFSTFMIQGLDENNRVLWEEAFEGAIWGIW